MALLKIRLEYDSDQFADGPVVSINLEKQDFDGGEASAELEPDILYYVHAVFRANEANTKLVIRLIPPQGFRVRFRERKEDLSSSITWKTSILGEPVDRRRRIYLEAVVEQEVAP